MRADVKFGCPVERPTVSKAFSTSANADVLVIAIVGLLEPRAHSRPVHPRRPRHSWLDPHLQADRARSLPLARDVVVRLPMWARGPERAPARTGVNLAGRSRAIRNTRRYAIGATGAKTTARSQSAVASEPAPSVCATDNAQTTTLNRCSLRQRRAHPSAQVDLIGDKRETIPISLRLTKT